MTRVLFVTGEYPPLRGGIADYLARLRASLGKFGIDSAVLSSTGAEGADVSTVGDWTVRALPRIWDVIRRKRPDIVHIQYQAGAFGLAPVANALPRLIQTVCSIPAVTTFHDLRPPYLFPKAGRLRTLCVLRMARASSVVIVTNPADRLILDRRRISAWEIPVGPSLPQGHRAEAREETSVGFFGFPSREKGIVDLIEALATFPSDSRPSLVLVGAARPDQGWHRFLDDDLVDALAEARGVRVVRTGYLPEEEAAAVLAGLDLVCLPFPGGATPRSSALISVLEAGAPVVTTKPRDRQGLDELARMRQLRLATPGDIASLAREIAAVINARPAIDPLPERFQWESIAERHRDLYAAVLAGAAG
jgi:glycosyltransferase involved in cell wall biosynthesis